MFCYQIQLLKSLLNWIKKGSPPWRPFCIISLRLNNTLLSDLQLKAGVIKPKEKSIALCHFFICNSASKIRILIINKRIKGAFCSKIWFSSVLSVSIFLLSIAPNWTFLSIFWPTTLFRLRFRAECNYQLLRTGFYLSA